MNDSRRKQSELSKYEWDMMQEWIEKNKLESYKCYFSVRVGSGADTENIKEAWLRKLVRHNTQQKIDCVVHSYGYNVRIVEVKRVASPGAIGQLLSYKKLYDEEYETSVSMILLCRYASNTMLKLCDHFGIKVETLGTYN